MKAHPAELREVAWASPLFGALLASCADDGVKLWTQRATEWKLVSSLPTAARHLAFAPPEHGALLAAAADGAVRLYGPAEELALWELQARPCETSETHATERLATDTLRGFPAWPGLHIADLGSQRRGAAADTRCGG